MVKQSADEKNEVIIPLIKGLVFPLEKLCGRLGVFLSLAGVVSLFYTFIVYLIGQNYFCLFQREGLWCVESATLSAASIMFWLAGLAYFINRWYLCAYCQVGVCDALKTICWKKDLKTFGFIAAYFGLWLVIGVVFYLLKKRVPSPDWLVELFYFVLGSFFVIAAVVLLTNAVIFVRFLQGKNWMVLKQTVGPLFDNIYKIFVFFMFYLLLFVVLIQQIKVVFWEVQYFPMWLNGMLISFFYYVAVCMLAVFFVASLEYQAKYIFTEKMLVRTK